MNSDDLGLQLNNFGSTTSLDWNNGYVDGNMVVDSADLGQLLNNFGINSAAAAAVPEPAGLSMVLFAMIDLLDLSRRRK